MEQEILLAQPRGFCAGVDRAIAIVEAALERYDAPVYVRHEIVHNTYVVSGLRERGAVFVELLEEVPKGGIVVFSAHGVSQAVRDEAEKLGLRVFDATCPLVTKVHAEVARMVRAGHEIIMIGHAGHPELEGTMGQAPGQVLMVQTVEDVAALQVRDPAKLGYVSQTTLSVDDTAEIIAALQARFPSLHAPKKSDICYATTNRQQAVRFMAPQVDVVIVVGSPSSSNSNRLREVATRMGKPAYMVDAADQIDPQWLAGHRRVGLTAGASAPEVLVQEVIQHLRSLGIYRVRILDGEEEGMSFVLPKELRSAPAA